MKQYFITSLYSEGTQLAIQQDHAGKEIVKNVLNNLNSQESLIYQDYINNHKTTISLGVGQPIEILKIYSFIMHHKKQLQIPVGIFQESSLNNTPTCLSFVATKKLGLNIQKTVSDLLSKYKINDLYSLNLIHDELFPLEYICPYYNTIIVVNKNRHDEFVFNVTVKEPIYENTLESTATLDLSDPDVIESLYKDYNRVDHSHYNKIDLQKDSIDKFSTFTYEYNLAELNFLIMIKSLRLK